MIVRDVIVEKEQGRVRYWDPVRDIYQGRDRETVYRGKKTTDNLVEEKSY